MSRRVLWYAASSPSPFLHSLKPFYRFFTADDALRGFIAHNEIGGAVNAPQRSPAQCLSSKDLAFLKDSISDSKAEVFEAGKCSTDALSIINTIKSYYDGLGEESQKFLRKFRSKLDEDLMVDVLRNVRSPDLGIKFFMWAGRQIVYSHTVATYDALLELLGGGREERVDDHFLIEIKKDDAEMLGRLLNALIRKCCRSGMWNLTLEELGRLKDLGYKPSRATYNALIRVFLVAGKLDSALLLHREMMNLGFKI